MFKTGHALPLVGTRILRPRSRRGEVARCPRKITATRPAARHIRDLDSAANQPQQQFMQECGQFVSSVYPRQQAPPQMLHINDAKSQRAISELAAVTKANGPSSAHGFTVLADQPCPRPRNIRMPAPDIQPFRHRIVATFIPPVQFLVRIHINSGL